MDNGLDVHVASVAVIRTDLQMPVITFEREYLKTAVVSGLITIPLIRKSVNIIVALYIQVVREVQERSQVNRVGGDV